MKTYIKKLTPIAAFTAIALLPSAAFASDLSTHSVAVESEISIESVPVMTDIIYEAVLANAAERTLEEKNEWFQVMYRDARTETVTRNISNSAESRYMDMEDGDRIELEIPAKDIKVQVQKIDFKMGTGPKPATDNTFIANKLVLPES